MGAAERQKLFILYLCLSHGNGTTLGLSVMTLYSIPASRIVLGTFIYISWTHRLRKFTVAKVLFVRSNEVELAIL